MLDYTSILIGAVFSGTCLSATMLVIWFTARQAEFLLTMALAIVVLMLHIAAFWQLGTNPGPWTAQATLFLLILGFFTIYCSTNQYHGLRHHRTAVLPTLAAMAAAGSATAAGYDGSGFILAYTTVTVLLILTGMMFWVYGSPGRILVVVSLLSGGCALSFGLCALVLLWNGEWTIGTVPDNWAEKLNMVVAVACMTALGALTLSMHHLRTQTQLVHETMTDPLTGLMNRRALNTLFADRAFDHTMALAIFDLDHFKRTNDVFGHLVGDKVLRRFASVIRKHAPPEACAFRLGGEEFVLVLSRVPKQRAYEMVRKTVSEFGAEIVSTQHGPLRSTVSAGISFGTQQGLSLDEMLNAADGALYKAKREGRNRCVSCNEMREAG